MPALNITANSIAALTECHDVHRYRTVAGIVQSCATTIFLCIWVVLHPDVPDPDASTWKRMFLRIYYMFGALLAPEIVFAFAFREWIESSGCLKSLIRKRPRCRWTETHAMFAHMGGFQLIGKDGSKTHLKGKAFFIRVSRGEIDIPKVTVKEILDKSKGDWIAKAIILVQTFWFALQVINRYAQHLPVTELEITTLAHVTLNVFIYWCWWNKPLNITIPIDIPEKNGESDITEQTSKQSGEGSADMVQQNEDENSETDKEGLLGDREAQASRPQLSIRVRMGALYTDADGKRILTRYGPVGAILSGIFGGIHCLAWYSTFHTHVESILWRICAPTVAVLPFILFCSGSISDFDIFSSIGPSLEYTFVVLGIIGTVFYVFARVCLLILALLALRTVPEKALLIPSWTQYIPHI